jgi:WD40 repeat protein
MWDGISLELLKTLEGHSSYVTTVSWNYDGSEIVSGSQDNTTKIWDSCTGRAHIPWKDILMGLLLLLGIMTVLK